MASTLYTSNVSAVVSQILTAPVPHAAVTIYTQGFESGTDSWAAGASTTVNQSSGGPIPHTGTYALRVNRASGTTALSASRTITGLTIGLSYTATAWVRDNSDAGTKTVFLSVTGLSSGSTASPSTTYQQVSYTFTATATSHVLVFNSTNTASSNYTSYWDDVAVVQNAHTDPAVLADYALGVISGSVKLDESRAPYAEGSLSVALPDSYYSEQVTPFTGLRLKITASQTFTAPTGRPSQTRTFDLLLHEVQIDSESAVMRLVGESDEASLIGYAEGSQQRTYTRSVKDNVTYALAKIGATLQAGAADATLTPSSSATPIVNLVRNPRAAGGLLTDWGGGAGGGTVTATGYIATGGPESTCPGFYRYTTSNAANSYVNMNNGATASASIPVSAGTSYDVSAWSRASVSGLAYADIQFYNSSGVLVLDSNQTTTSTTANTWTRVSTLGLVAPYGAAWVLVRLVLQPTSGAFASGVTLDFTGFRLSTSTTGSTASRTVYFDGDIQATHDGYYWSGQPHLSTSNWIVNEPVATNLITNPSFEVSNASAPTAITNLTSGVQSTDWAQSGTQSLKLIANGASTDGFASYSENGALSLLGMVPGSTYTVSGYFHVGATPLAGTTGPNARAIFLGFRTSGGAVIGTDQISTAAANTANTTTRVSITFTVPANAATLYLRFYNGHTVGTGYWDALMLTVGSTLLDYFDGSTSSADYTNTWATAPGASTSLRIGPHLADATVWKPGVTAWDWVAPLVSAGKLRLFCDEQRQWRLVDPTTYVVSGLISIASGTNATSGSDLRSLQASDPDGTPTYFSLCVVHWTWTDSAGLSQEFYESAGTPGQPLTIEIERPYPGAGYAAAVLARAQGKGRTQDITALADLTATPGMELVTSLPGVAAEDGTLASVEWRWDMESEDSALMSVGSRGLISTPANAWVLALGNWSAATGTWAAATGTN